jgi:uncharacterized membrane protein
MPGTPKREELDRLAAFYSLSADGTQRMLDLAGARPTRAEGLGFVARCLRYGGVLSLASAVVFFVAANWSRFAVFGRFALLEVLVLALATVAFIRPPPAFPGRAALFLAFISTGALLALFGQTYQTGADVYELFVTWSLLALPLVVAAQWSVASAAWVLVLDVALLLYCGWQPQGGALWILFDSRRYDISLAMLASAFVNLALWALFQKLDLRAVPDWVRRLLVFFAMAFVTWVGMRASIRGFEAHDGDPNGLVFLGTLAALAIPSIWALRERRDVFPLAMAMTAAILIVLSLIPHVADHSNEGVLLLMALWLIGASTAGGKWLLHLQRSWRERTARA